jgi:hypothetical protein
MPRQKQDNSDIPGLTTALTTPYIIGSVTIVVLWLVLQQGLLHPIFGSILGLIAIIGLTITSRSVYASLMKGTITRPGCLLALGVYFATTVILLLILAWVFWENRMNPLAWMDLLNIALVGVLIIPLLGFGSAFLHREPGKKHKPHRRR